VTIYVLLGREDGRNPVRYFIAKNCDLTDQVSSPPNWKENAFMMLKSVERYEGRWDLYKKQHRLAQ
jgi:hypothetical protein